VGERELLRGMADVAEVMQREPHFVADVFAAGVEVMKLECER
jgi:catalase (peroxidase I)